MEIHKGNCFTKFNYADNLKELFAAMERGLVIKEIVLNEDYKKIHGNATITDFKATDYWVGMQSDIKGNRFDYVDGNSSCEITSFYMSWIISFKL